MDKNKMVFPKVVFYKGKKYRVQTSGRYYQSYDKMDDERLLHRRIYVDHFGSIPDGYEIHHKDNNWANNAICNLEMVSRADHRKKHMLEQFKNDEYRQKNKEHLLQIGNLAKKWHSSDSGKEWHKEHAKKSWENREPKKLICSICKKETEKFFTNRGNTRFCSKKCSSKEAYTRYFTKKNICKKCNKEFMANRHKKTVYCSYKCSNGDRKTNISL